MSDDARTLSKATVDAYWTAGHRVSVPIPGKPSCRIVFDPSYGTIGLQTPLQGREPDVATLRNIGFETFTEDGDVWGEVRVVARDSHHAAFAMLSSIADRIQQFHQSLAVAVPHAVQDYKSLLAGRHGLNNEQQIGLAGELLLLRHLVGQLGPTAAVPAWHGPLAEEHDFFFASAHFEVKTTSGERRRHVIGNISQLTQSPGTPLWLVSIQLTAGARGASVSLPQLVAEVRTAAGDERPELDRRLGALGWENEHVDLYLSTWQLRSTPRVYRIQGDFPRITDEIIGDRVPSWNLVSDVSYRVDLSNLPYPLGPAALLGFVESEGKNP